MHQSGSFKIKPGYSDSMINAIHDNAVFEHNDSGISAETQSITPRQSAINSSMARRHFENKKNIHPTTMPRPGWVPSLGPSFTDLNITTAQDPVFTPMDTN